MKKVTRSHTTIIDAARPLLQAAEKSEHVTKISLGIIKNIGTGKTGLKFQPTTGGMKVVVRGNTTIQELYIYTKEVEKVTKILTHSFPLPN
jgi:hypothetical protein